MAQKTDLTAYDIVKAYLMQHGYDGLYCDHDSCGCGCEIDEIPSCDHIQQNCKPGYKVPCDCGEHCPWHIGPKKPKKGRKDV